MASEILNQNSSLLQYNPTLFFYHYKSKLGSGSPLCSPGGLFFFSFKCVINVFIFKSCTCPKHFAVFQNFPEFSQIIPSLLVLFFRMISKEIILRSWKVFKCLNQQVGRGQRGEDTNVHI